MRDILASLAVRLWRGAVDFIAPPRCLVCRVPLGDGASLCPACWSGLRFIDSPVCDVMGTPFAYDQGGGAVSAAALANPPPWRRARAAVAFDDASRPLVHGLKYHDMPEAGLLMSRMMARAGRGLLAETDLLVPVPLHRWKQWRRRFNQASFLALRLAATAGKPCRSDVLVRVKATRSQVGLDTEARRRNVKGAFRVAASRLAEISGKRIVLVDDVMTTGATAGACAAALRAAGAAEVDVLSFALVLEPQRRHI